MDADDVAMGDRLATQMEFVSERECDLVGASMLEFRGTTPRVSGERVMPLRHEAIVRRLRWSNPINHPTVLVRRSAVLEAGNYRDVPSLEDYDLWVRMVGAGAVMANLPEPLVMFRADDHLRRRGIDRAALRGEMLLQRELRRVGLSGLLQSLLALLLRVAFRAMPTVVMSRLYRRMFLGGRVRVGRAESK
jgi:hypothetical protein